MPAELLGFLDTGEPLPFEDLFVSLVLNARRELRRQAGAVDYGLLTAEAHTGWERFLLRRFTFAGAKAAHWQFQVFRTVRTAFPIDSLGSQRSKDVLYRQFIGKQPAERLRTLFSEFPALEKLCAVLIKNWIATVVDFLARLDTDFAEFNLHFPGGTFVYPVIKVAAGLGDPHCGGRCVVKITCEGETSIIYKPRSIAPEAHFSVLLDELVPDSIPHSLRSVQCWNRGAYGWMEDVTTSPCSSLAGVHAFYWRTGVLLGLVYLARGVDFHRENLIASGECPILVDLEGLWHPQTPGWKQPSPLPSDSILRTGFLPQDHPQEGMSYEWGALSRRLRAERFATTWVHLNQDQMALGTKRREFRDDSHLPIFAGQHCLASEYLIEIQAGYQWTGEKLLSNDGRRDEFGRWIGVLVRCPRRLILRPTGRYQAILERLTLPQSLRREKMLANLETEFTDKEEPEIEGEAVALEQMDVPYFDQFGGGADRLFDSSQWPPSKERYLAQIAVIETSLSVDRRASGVVTNVLH